MTLLQEIDDENEINISTTFGVSTSTKICNVYPQLYTIQLHFAQHPIQCQSWSSSILPVTRHSTSGGVGGLAIERPLLVLHSIRTLSGHCHSQDHGTQEFHSAWYVYLLHLRSLFCRRDSGAEWSSEGPANRSPRGCFSWWGRRQIFVDGSKVLFFRASGGYAKAKG